MKRWEYFKGHMNYLFDCGHHSFYRLSFLTNDEIWDALNNSSLDLDKLQKNGSLEVQIISEWERIFLHDKQGVTTESLYYKRLYENGDNSAIIEFCRNNDTALRSTWVIEQIERWKREKTLKSNKKLKGLFKAFTDTRGKSSTEKNIEFLKEDKKICDAIQKLLDDGLSINQVLKKIAARENKSFEVVKDIYYGYLGEDYNKKNILSDENLKILRKSLLRLRFMPIEGESFPSFIDETINKLFLHTEEFDNEYNLYRKMRLAYQNVIFDGKQPMLRKKMDNSIKENLKTIINKLSQEKHIAQDYLQEIYKTFRKMEIMRNDDSSRGDSWEDPHEIIEKELFEK